MSTPKSPSLPNKGSKEGDEPGDLKRVAGQLGLSAGEALEVLVERLRTGDDYERERAAEQLAQLGPSAVDALPALERALADRSDAVCIESVRAIVSIGPEAARQVPALLEMMEARGAEVGGQCWGVPIGEVPRLGQPAVPHLVAALGTPMEESAVAILSMMEAAALPELLSLAEGTGPKNEAARRVFGVMSDRLVSLVDSSRSPERVLIINALSYARENPRAAEAVARLLRDRKTEVRQQAAAALRRLAPADPRVVAGLIDALEDVDVGVRITAAKALGRIGPAARAALGRLGELATHPEVGAEARTAIELIDRAEPPVPKS